MNHRSGAVIDGSTGLRNLRWIRCLIIVLAAITLGLAYNALSPDGIPLVKKTPSMTNS